jgi:hypothetical protein
VADAEFIFNAAHEKFPVNNAVSNVVVGLIVIMPVPVYVIAGIFIFTPAVEVTSVILPVPESVTPDPKLYISPFVERVHVLVELQTNDALFPATTGAVVEVKLIDPDPIVTNVTPVFTVYDLNKLFFDPFIVSVPSK